MRMRASIAALLAIAGLDVVATAQQSSQREKYGQQSGKEFESPSFFNRFSHSIPKLVTGFHRKPVDRPC